MAREMKDSGVEWIGEIPVDWTLKKIKNAIELIGSGTTPSSNNKDYFNGDIYWIQSGDIYGKDNILDTSVKVTKEAIKLNSALQIYQKEFIVIAMYGGSVGNIAISLIDACVNQACCCIKTNHDNLLRFMFYWIFMCKDDFLRQSVGGGQPNISQAKIKNEYYAQPQLAEQDRIVSFLDAKCIEIDKILSKTRNSIDEYKKLKQAVITQAVTKGVRGDREMKDSGIEWIGDIPTTWEKSKLKHHLRRNEPRNPGNVIVLSLYRELGVIPKDSRDDNHNVTSENTSNYKYVKPGNFVVNKMKAWQGSVAVSEYEGIVSPAYFVYQFTDDVYLKKYFHYLLRGCYKDEFRRLSGGIRIGQWDLSSDALDNIPVIIPTISEQQTIVNYLDTKCSEIDNLIVKKEQYLAEIENYKKSLIYEYVTGKKEVPQEYKA